MALICKTIKDSSHTRYQISPDSDIYLSFAEMHTLSNLPIYLLKGRIYRGITPQNAMYPPPPLPFTLAQPKPQRPCALPGCDIPTSRSYCGRGHATQHRALLRKEHGLPPSRTNNGNTNPHFAARSNHIDRTTQCIHDNISCVHYHRWLSELTNFFCKCTGYIPPP